ncbi:MAG: DUF393 domain-containing protein [Bacteroidales bacterium]|jgi:predicted DCC family thiol-disulfide oxidoreductase YuxK|nr:DUF393 domain-containing protein [Bacteroidales bacterium]
MINYENILLFDGFCNLCSRLVNFIIKRDKKAKFLFVSLQSASGQSLQRDDTKFLAGKIPVYIKHI